MQNTKPLLASASPPHEPVKTCETSIPATDAPADMYYPVPATDMTPQRFPLPSCCRALLLIQQTTPTLPVLLPAMVPWL